MEGHRLSRAEAEYAVGLLDALLAGLHVEGERGVVDLTPEIIDALAAWRSEVEDFEEDDPREDSHDEERDVWYGDDQSDERAPAQGNLGRPDEQWRAYHRALQRRRWQRQA